MRPEISRPCRIVVTSPSELPTASWRAKIAFPFRRLKKSICPLNVFDPYRKFFFKFRSTWL
jgi:hypothetical protein